ncbi:hypothetical protein F1559_005190 [Cyanidiococcus yangmingshanensis]|uniref:Uncharacterized protein n=1 Tax=Cyanidiococcus yangmingshanensis TaxID=2690220 RepID=A0A7J7IJX7_9RHOD|nr:hypothetical protein F1559_005190 [Cyanidiococcus yangmingshanensis]
MAFDQILRSNPERDACAQEQEYTDRRISHSVPKLLVATAAERVRQGIFSDVARTHRMFRNASLYRSQSGAWEHLGRCACCLGVQVGLAWPRWVSFHTCTSSIPGADGPRYREGVVMPDSASRLGFDRVSGSLMIREAKTEQTPEEIEVAVSAESSRTAGWSCAEEAFVWSVM